MGKQRQEVSENDVLMAELLSEISKSKKVSGRQIARETGISVGRVSELLAGRKAFYMTDVNLICAVLGEDASAVMKRVEDHFQNLDAR